MDGLVLWEDAKFQGAKASFSSSVSDLSKKYSLSAVKSIEVVGKCAGHLKSSQLCSPMKKRSHILAVESPFAQRIPIKMPQKSTAAV